jgi:predicted membrane metal-binding protein
MQGILYEEPSAWLFLLVTVVLGGWTAWMTGRAVASTWRPAVVALLWTLPLAGAVRFIHFALFGGTFLSLRFFLVDLAVVAAVALLAHRYTRTRQMTRQYRWLYDRTGPFTWREKAQA